MTNYFLRRLLALIPVLFGISLLAFVISMLAPGDPAGALYQQLYGEQPRDAETLERFRQELGLNDPAPLRYLRWLGGVAQGNLGASFRSGQPVLHELTSNAPPTLLLALGGLAVSVALAFPLGVLSALRPNGGFDLLARLFSLLGAAMPSFWLAYLLILLFAVRLRWLPVAGLGTWQHLVLPCLTLGLAGAATLSRLIRSSLLEVLGQDYVRTARAKGLREGLVVLRHALRNALLPVVTVLGNRFAALLAGAVIIETIFAWPGLGKLILDAIAFRDYPLIQGFVLFTGLVFVLVNLAVDLLYRVIDPRIRL
ncbi:MAG: ABC transporter permease [Chloroflexaceae bacterium]|jgi:peptide/nickel transport system permease protein|nr:ABC transporter permease [Chloroflexaceae bacterium]